jgi:hypothetical protein
VVFPLIDKQGCITVKTNFYSVPIQSGVRVEARVHPLHVEVWHAGRLIARHERCHSRRQHVLDLEHYLDVLSRLARSPGPSRGAHACIAAAATELDRGILGGFKRSSQHDLCWPIGRHRPGN